MTAYPRCHFLKANVVICPPSRNLHAGFVKLVEISQSSQMVLCIHHIWGGDWLSCRDVSKGAWAIQVSLIRYGPTLQGKVLSV